MLHVTVSPLRRAWGLGESSRGATAHAPAPCLHTQHLKLRRAPPRVAPHAGNLRALSPSGAHKALGAQASPGLCGEGSSALLAASPSRLYQLPPNRGSRGAPAPCPRKPLARRGPTGGRPAPAGAGRGPRPRWRRGLRARSPAARTCCSMPRRGIPKWLPGPNKARSTRPSRASLRSAPCHSGAQFEFTGRHCRSRPPAFNPLVAGGEGPLPGSALGDRGRARHSGLV